jgi:hypothetical protein
VQPGEGELRLRFAGGNRQYPHAGRPGLFGYVRQEHGLAHARLADDQQDLAGQRDRVDEPAQPGEPRFPADDALWLLP